MAGHFLMGGEAAGGATGESEVGIKGEEKGGRGEFLQKKRFFGAVGAAKGYEGVRTGEKPTDSEGGLLIEKAYRFAMKKGGMGLVNFFPEPPEGGVRVEGRGG